jgi:hypothetical protein
MQFVIYDWSNKCKKELSTLKIQHNEIIDGDIFEWTKKFFDLGINVMLYHPRVKGENPILFIDTKRFGQA